MMSNESVMRSWSSSTVYWLICFVVSRHVPSIRNEYSPCPYDVDETGGRPLSSATEGSLNKTVQTSLYITHSSFWDCYDIHWMSKNNCSNWSMTMTSMTQLACPLIWLDPIDLIWSQWSAIFGNVNKQLHVLMSMRKCEVLIFPKIMNVIFLSFLHGKWQKYKY